MINLAVQDMKYIKKQPIKRLKIKLYPWINWTMEVYNRIIFITRICFIACEIQTCILFLK